MVGITNLRGELTVFKIDCIGGFSAKDFLLALPFCNISVFINYQISIARLPRPMLTCFFL